jgi:hypothetical protein
MQLMLDFLDPPSPPLPPLPAVPAPPPWDQVDAAVRVAALEILARLIVRMLAAKQPQETSND